MKEVDPDLVWNLALGGDRLGFDRSERLAMTLDWRHCSIDPRPRTWLDELNDITKGRMEVDSRRTAERHEKWLRERDSGKPKVVTFANNDGHPRAS